MSAGNAVATASFTGKTDALRIESKVELDLTGNPWPIFNIAATALNFPFFYSNDDRADLGALAIQQYLDPMGRLQKWARSFVRGAAPDTLELLKAISHGVSEALQYEVRESEGTQTPIESLDRGQGFVPRLRHPVRRGGAQPGHRRPDRVGLSVRSAKQCDGFLGLRIHPRVGRGLCAWGWLDQLRSDQSQHRRIQSGSGRRCPRHHAADAGVGQLCWCG